ncbi:GAF domain-containing protein [Methylobacterium sp. J-078]|uniref:GAF domain-containing protein n=1 Tax=Methylobacterium sp. J-078 TaxID=2836657 RepID=UPI001FB893C6|nr:GAF domain-containing protein [Methylobacterium sp. J-078]MCJ2046389.1 GAF domain-containing protein [Methylobacterium sp. J-078]
MIADPLATPDVLDLGRLAALDAYDILDTAPEKGFDDVVLLARNICGTSVALVSLVAGNRQWFKARIGFPDCETDLNASVCAHVLAEPDLLVIPDLTKDPRTQGNSLVTGGPRIRFYAGAPLRTPEGKVLGSLCVIDGEPRPGGLTHVQVESLRALAGQVMAQMELRRALASQRRVVEQRDSLIRTQGEVTAARGDITAILDALANGALKAVRHAEGAVIEMLEGDELVYRASKGTLLRHAGLRVPLKGSLAGACLLGNEPSLVPDVLVDPRVKRDLIEVLDLRSCVLIPVRRAGKPVGVLKLQSSRPDAFTEADLRLAQLFAATVSAGLSEAGEAAANLQAARSERRRKAVFDSAVDYAIILRDLDANVTDWNEGATAILGWHPEEMIGKPTHAFYTPEDRRAGVPEQEMRDALVEGRASDERWHLKRDGTRFWANGELMVLRDEDGAAIGFMKILRDRTEQRLGFERLRETEDRLRRAQEAGGVGMFHVDAEGILYPTPEFCRLYGLPVRDAYPSTAFERLVIPEDAAFVSTADSRASGEAPRDVEYRIRRPDNGEIRWIARRGELEHDEAGRLVRFSGVSRDITEQRVAREALAESERHWRGLFERLREGFILGRVIRDATGQVTDWRYEEVNRAWGELVGVASVSVVGRTIREVFPGIEDEWVREFADVVETDRSATFTRQVGTLDRWYEGRVHKLTDDTFAVLFLEVTERFLAERARGAEERRKSALLELGDRLRDLTRIPEMTLMAAGVVGRSLKAGRVGFGRLDAAGGDVMVEPDWTAPGLQSIAGQHRFEDYGDLRSDLLKGETVIVSDTANDPRTASNLAALQAIDIASLINIPVCERGRTVALLFIHDSAPRHWTQEELAFLRAVADRVEAAVARVRAEEQQQLLNRELSHRMKNTLAMVQAIATQTLRGATDMEGAKEVLVARLLALGKAHDILMNNEGESQVTDIQTVVENALSLHDDPERRRFDLQGPLVACGSRAALSLALMVHELATNAAKYGALSVPEGRIDLTWSIDADADTVHLAWLEDGGPTVIPPTRIGFGSRLIERGLAGAVGGQVELSYPPEGVRCILIAPLSGFVTEG